MQGNILGYNATKQTGVISIANGQRLMFRLSDWRHAADQPPQAGVLVEFDAHGDRARHVRMLAPAPRPASAPPPQTTPSPTTTQQPFQAGLTPPSPPPQPPEGKAANNFAGYCGSAGIVLMGLCWYGIESVKTGNFAFGVNTGLWSIGFFCLGVIAVIMYFISSITALAVSGGKRGWDNLLGALLFMVVIVGVTIYAMMQAYQALIMFQIFRGLGGW